MKNLTNKPTLIFTDFWNADKILENQYLSCVIDGTNCKINLFFDSTNIPINFYVCSIDAVSPTKTNENLSNLFKVKNKIVRVNCLCPSYELVEENYSDEEYKNKYLNLLKSRKDSLMEWINSLESNTVYILCGWKNERHIKILYDFLLSKRKNSLNLIHIESSFDSGLKKHTNTINLKFEKVFNKKHHDDVYEANEIIRLRETGIYEIVNPSRHDISSDRGNMGFAFQDGVITGGHLNNIYGFDPSRCTEIEIDAPPDTIDIENVGELIRGFSNNITIMNNEF